MTILSLLQNFCYVNGTPFPAAGTIYGNTSTGARQLLGVLYRVSRRLRRARCWTQQKKIHTFTTEVSRTAYPLPEDYYSISALTDWNNDENRNLVGPLDDPQFTQRLNGGVGSSLNFEYRFFGPDSNPATAGGQFQVYPTPADTIELSYEYLTKNLFLPPYWSASEAGITVGKYRNANGNIYKCSAITTGTTGTTPPSHTSSTAVDGGVTWLYITAPYETVLSDNDLCLFDEDLVELGVAAYWRDEKGEENAAKVAEFEKAINTAVFRIQGNVKGSFAQDPEIRPRYTTPLGGFL